MRRACLVMFAACSHPGATTAEVAVPTGPPPAPIRAVDTRVVELVAHQATPLLVGPWLVTSINPGGVEMMISPTGRCDDGLWFDYSGSGVAVPAAETLCVRSSHRHTVGFSGHAP
jgi:hypothetical protein